MKDAKREVNLYSFFDHTHIAAHLEQMAARGWMLEKMGNYFWTYRRVEPTSIRFSVTYYPRASAFDPEPTAGELDFREFCERTGWELAASNAQMQVFCNRREDPLPIETDPVMEVDTIHRTVKRTFLPTWFIMLALAIFMVWMLIGSLLHDPIGLLSSANNTFTGLCWMMLFVMSAVEIGGYFRWRRRAKKAAARGEFLDTPSHKEFQIVSLVLLVLGLAWYLGHLISQGDRLLKWIYLAMVVYIVLLFLAVNGTKRFLKRKKVSKNINRAVTLTVDVVLAVVMMGGIVFGIFWLVDSGHLPLRGQGDTETYEYRGQVWYLYRDNIPLRVEDLVDVDYDRYITSRSGDDSLILSQFNAYQRPRLDAADYYDMPTLEYTVTSVKLPAIYNFCRDTICRQSMEDAELFSYEYVERDSAPWGANQVWEQMDLDGHPRNHRFILCYDTRIIEIRFSWEPSAAQMAIVGEKLGG